jgi:hypothetical protein
MEYLLKDLEQKKLIDSLVLFVPNQSLKAGKNELKKRNIGLSIAKKNRCSHFLAMDCDEFYKQEQFNFAKQFIKKNNVSTSSCKHIAYIKEPIYQFATPASYYVPFISKINIFSKFASKNYYPVLTDPFRKLDGSKRFKYFDENEVLMHHFSLVRKDIGKKYLNSSAKTIFDKTNIIDCVDNYQFPNDFIDPVNTEQGPIKIREVGNYFNIKF